MCPSEDRSAPVPEGLFTASSTAAGSWLPRFEELASSAEAARAAATPRALRTPAPQRRRGKTRQRSTLSLMPRRRARRGFKTPRPCTTISAPVSTGQSRAAASRRGSRNSRASPRTRCAADLQRKGGRDCSHRGTLPRVETFGGPAGLAGWGGRGGQDRSRRGRRPDHRRHRGRDRLGRRRRALIPRRGAVRGRAASIRRRRASRGARRARARRRSDGTSGSAECGDHC